MKNKFLKIIFVLFSICLVSNVNAASGSLGISATANTLRVGQTVTISVYAKGLTGTFKVVSSDSNILSGGNSSSWIENDTATYTFTAKKSGTVTVTVSSIAVNHNDDYSEFNGSKSVTLKVVEASSSSNSSSGGSSNNNSSGTTADKKTYSSDNTLASLSIDGFKFSPEFKKDITEYELTVDESVEKVKINAKANDSKASVRGDGEISLSNGENNVEIKVTAENGNEKVYKIKINVIDENPIKVTIDGKEYTVIKKNNNVIDKLDGYEEKSIKIDNQDVVSYANSNNKLTLIILKDNDGKVNYYIYEDNNYILYDEVNLGGVKLLVLDMPDDKIVSGYKKYSFKYNNKEYVGYKLNKSSDYYLIYAMDLSNGEKDLYLYDSKVNSVIRYDDDISKYYSDKYNNDTRMYKIIFIAMAGVILLIIVVSLIRSIAKGKKKNINYKG